MHGRHEKGEGRPLFAPKVPAMLIGSAFDEILNAAKGGGEWAWERLFDSVAAQLRGYLAAQGAAEPDDLTSQVLLGLVSGIGDFDGDERRFRSWVFVMAHHRLIDERRRGRKHDDLRARLAAPASTPPADSDIGERLDESGWAERLAKLTDDQRSVVLLRVIAGLSAEETARVMGKRPGAVRVLQHRALQRLREIVLADVTE